MSFSTHGEWGPPWHPAAKDSNFGFEYMAAKDSEFGFDPHTSMTSFPKFIPPSEEHAGEDARSQRTGQDAKSFRSGMSFRQAKDVWIRGDIETFSCHPDRTQAQTQTDTSSDVIPRVQIASSTSRSPASDMMSQAVKRTYRRTTSSRKTSQPRAKVRAASDTTSSASSFLSSSGLSSTGSKPLRQRKAKKQNSRTLPLSHEIKRKLSLEKNKVAAANCRFKKKRMEDNLQTKSRELASINTVLKDTVSQMTEHLQQLQSMLALHLLSGDCHVPADVSEVVRAQSSDFVKREMSPYDQHRSESSTSLRQESFTPESHRGQDFLVEDGFFPDLPPLESFSSVWDCPSPSLDLRESFKSTTLALADSIRCDPGRS